MPICPDCGAELDDPNPKFCGECGKPVAEADASSPNIGLQGNVQATALSVTASVREVVPSTTSAGSPPCPQGASDSPAHPLAIPIAIDINRNRFYMEGRGGVLELRIFNCSAADAVIGITVESALCEWIGSQGREKIHLPPGGRKAIRTQMRPSSAGEIVVNLTVECKAGSATRRFTAEPMIRVLETNATPQNLSITIDQSLKASGDVYAASMRSQADDLLKKGIIKSNNDLLERAFPDDWQPVELYDATFAEQARIESVLQMPVSDLEWSIRTSDYLKRENIRTISDLVMTSEEALLETSNIHQTSLHEIKSVLATKGLRLRASRAEFASPVGSALVISGSKLRAPRAEDWVELAVYCLKNERYHEAIADCTEAIRLAPNYLKAFDYRGEGYQQIREYQKAIADYTEAIRLEADATHYWQRGDLYLKMNEYDKAIADCTEAIRLSPDFGLANGTRGDAYAAKCEYQKAIGDYTLGIRVMGEHFCKLKRGEAYRRIGDHENAISDYSDLIEAFMGYEKHGDHNLKCRIHWNVETAPAYMGRGESYCEKGEYDKAIADFTEVLRLTPDVASAYWKRGESYGKAGEHDKAIADFTEAIRLSPDVASAYWKRGMWYRNRNQFDKAIDDLTNAFRLWGPQQIGPYNYFLRANTFKRTGQNDKAVADFTEAIRGSSTPRFQAQMYFCRGQTRLEIGECENAIGDFTEATRLNPSEYVFYWRRASARRKIRDFANAIADLETAVRLLKPNDIRFAAASMELSMDLEEAKAGKT